jgi:hypothetical protein
MSCNVKINKHEIFVEIARQIASASTEIPKPTLQRSHHLTPNGTLFYPSEPFLTRQAARLYDLRSNNWKNGRTGPCGLNSKTPAYICPNLGECSRSLACVLVLGADQGSATSL